MEGNGKYGFFFEKQEAGVCLSGILYSYLVCKV